MTSFTYTEMMEGLISTAIEYSCVGLDDEVDKIGILVKDLQQFWNSEEKLSTWDYVNSFEITLKTSILY